ncbi:Hpt domain-containing protein [Maribrevibacterium harenarium]|uniref:Hpt domain-containing protein n=1 Tax=Maribrevibacterium harenarium TaxID=2589817 RepID=A0A501WGA9_9GAMM|nr:Hpt domain-containing protein [Maribrevibacterium harenarium]TPE48438.1 Hpt domain-containing protein [Maribrevibacterium harenarium]
MTISETGKENNHTTPWPQIEGIDGDTARSHLLNDTDLFFSILRQVLNDYKRYMDLPTLDLDSEHRLHDRLQIARDMHKLSSIAGTIGATRIQQTAAQIEISVRQLGTEIIPLLQDISYSLTRLDTDARKIITENERSSYSLPSQTDVSCVIQQMMQLLKSSDLAALDHLEQHRALFQRQLPNPNYSAFEQAVTELAFDKACKILNNYIGEK